MRSLEFRKKPFKERESEILLPGNPTGDFQENPGCE